MYTDFDTEKVRMYFRMMNECLIIRRHIYSEENMMLITNLMYIESSLKTMPITREMDSKHLQYEFQKLHLYWDNKIVLEERNDKFKTFINEPITTETLNDLKLLISKYEKL